MYDIKELNKKINNLKYEEEILKKTLYMNIRLKKDEKNVFFARLFELEDKRKALKTKKVFIKEMNRRLK